MDPSFNVQPSPHFQALPRPVFSPFNPGAAPGLPEIAKAPQSVAMPATVVDDHVPFNAEGNLNELTLFLPAKEDSGELSFLGDLWNGLGEGLDLVGAWVDAAKVGWEANLPRATPWIATEHIGELGRLSDRITALSGLMTLADVATSEKPGEEAAVALTGMAAGMACAEAGAVAGSIVTPVVGTMIGAGAGGLICGIAGEAAMEAALPTIEAWGDSVMDTLLPPTLSAWNEAEVFSGQVFDAAAQQIETTGDQLSGLFHESRTAFDSAWDFSESWVSDSWDSFADWGGQSWDSLWD